MEIPKQLVTHLEQQGKSADWDVVERCGIGYFSTGEKDPFDDLCADHDLDFLKGGSSDDYWHANKKMIIGMWKRVFKIDTSLAPRATLYTLALTFLSEFWWRNYDRTVPGAQPNQPAQVDVGDRDEII